MMRQVCIGLVTFVVLMVLGMNLGLAQGLQESANTTSAAQATWFIDKVDSARVGRHVAVAVHPGTGTVYVSYYDQDQGDLRLATYVRSGGDCGPGNSWTCQAVDTGGDVGQYNSMDVYPGTNWPHTWRAGIAYYDATNHALKFAEYAYRTFPTPGYVWTISTIASGDSLNVYGQYASLKYDSTGIPHISYYRARGVGDDSLEYAHLVTSGGNCGPSNTWQCETVDSASDLGKYTSIALWGPDYPQIAYSSGLLLRHARYIGGSGSGCNPSSSVWMCNTIDPAGGKYIATDTDSMGYIHIAYYSEPNGKLKHAAYYGAGGNCGPGNAWQCDEIDDMGISLGTMGVSLAVDGAGYPIIAYQDASESLAPTALKAARPAAGLGLTPGDPELNCGPTTLAKSLSTAYTWQCQTVDHGGAYTDEAGSVSIGVSSVGLATIAYHELNSYPYPVEGNLKVAYQRLQIFLPLVLR